MADKTRTSHERWAHLRFSVVGTLLAAPPGPGELKAELQKLAAKTWQHPGTGEPTRFGFATIDRWYYLARNAELGTPPIHRYLEGPDVGRKSPDSRALRLAFCTEELRTQRRSDGTFTLEGVRFEVPSQYRHFERVTVRYARWDMTHVFLVDAKTSTVLSALYPLDRNRNADGARVLQARAAREVSGLPVERAHRLAECAEERRWLIDGLWADEGVGIVGRAQVL